MKKLVLTYVVLGFCIISNGQVAGVLSDIRDSRTYKTIEIFSQIWMAENLNTERFQNGDKIRKVNSSQEWVIACQRKEPVWMYYQNNEEYGKKFGKIYNYYAVIDKRNIAPQNFHIPTAKDFGALSKLSTSNLKSRDGWYSTSYRKKVLANVDKIDRNGFPYVDLDLVEREFTILGSGNNSSGFNAYPSGQIESNGTFNLLGKEIYFWLLSPGNYNNSLSAFKISWDNNESQIVSVNQTQGFYIRCVSGRTLEEIENEKEQKLKKEKAIADSIYIEKVKYEKLLDELNQKKEDSLRIIDNANEIKRQDLLRNNLKLFDYFNDGVVVEINEINGEKHGLLMSVEESLLRINELISKKTEFNNGWRIPEVNEMKSIVKLMKKNDSFLSIIEKTQYKGNTFGWGTAYWWYAIPEKNSSPSIDNLWWIFKSAIGKDQPIKGQGQAMISNSYSRLRLVKEF
jgi:uncharacterized protein (TIGR02145 family)